MSRYEHLPVFKATYDFTLYFYKVSHGFPKDYRYGLASEIHGLNMRLLDYIILANDSQDKRRYLDNASRCLNLIMIRVRLLSELKVINDKRYGFISTSLIGLTNQVNAWKKWSEKGRS